MTSFFSIDRANERIPEVRELLLLLRAQRRELIDLRDRYVALVGGDATGGSEAASRDRSETGGTRAAGDPPPRPAAPDERGGDASPDDGSTLTGLEGAELVKLRIQGIVDQMGASVARIDAWGITLRDIEAGLIDFPALVDGRQVWLCWRLGEDDVAWWHELDAGIAGRRPLAELEAGRGVH